MRPPLAARGDERIVIVGAGQAGARTAEALRAAGHSGPVSIVGAEPHLPYERPQLSKEVLIKAEPKIAFIKDAAAWSALNVDLHLGASALDCELDRQRLHLDNGQVLGFDRLVIATGVAPRRLPQIDNGPVPVLYLRTIEDALNLKSGLHPGKRLVVIGGGVIGLETAAAARMARCDVTVVEIGRTLLARALPEQAAAFLLRRHRKAGVAFHFGAAVERVEPGAVVLTDGTRLAADLVVVGVGANPQCPLARAIGLDHGDGPRVDAYGQTEAALVFAAGDVAAQWNPRSKSWGRIETWANAQNQSIALGKTLAGRPTEYADPVWFWSDQYEANLQVLGDMSTGDLIIRGDAEGDAFSMLALEDGIVRGAVTLNRRPEMAVLRKLVAQSRPVNRADLENAAFDLKKALN